MPVASDDDAAEGELVRSTRAGQTVAVDARVILTIARRHRLKVALLIQVGDAVSVGTPVMLVSGGEPLASRVRADVVDLALLEVFLCGFGQPQVSRRLTALVADLLRDLPDERDAALLAMRAQLVALVEGMWVSPELVRTALSPDRQGLGGTVSPT